MVDLPSERLTPANPFEDTTVDLFGPYEVKNEEEVKTQGVGDRLLLYGVQGNARGPRE